jgi:tyrosyl-tRNA synthetase
VVDLLTQATALALGFLCFVFKEQHELRGVLARVPVVATGSVERVDTVALRFDRSERLLVALATSAGDRSTQCVPANRTACVLRRRIIRSSLIGCQAIPHNFYDDLVIDFIDELQWRGIFHQASDLEGLRAHLAEGPRRAYIGFDPTAPSLHIGNLATLILLAHFQRAGHQPVLVAGGGTGLIGDPGGKSTERPLRSVEEVRENVVKISAILERFVPGAILVNNADWLVDLSYVHVLRDVGKHFSVNEMVKRDSVRNRLEGDGISYTEFSYMLLQAYDFQHLYRELGVTVQMGGSDQWGNIVSGVDLIRRMHGGEAFALTGPLIVKADGTKFGKTESGAVWISADRTSPYAFHQWCLNTDDADVIGFLKRFTFLTRTEIEELERETTASPGARAAQRALADELTTLLHGSEATERAKRAAQALFSGAVRELDEATMREAFDGVPTTDHDRSALGTGVALDTFLPATSLAASNREARDHLKNGSVLVNGERVEPDRVLTTDDLLHGDTILLRRGKKNWAVTRWS